MKIDTIVRHIREAYRGVKRNAMMSFAAISAVAVTLFIFGIFLIFAFNIRYMTQELDKQVAITAIVNEALNAQQKDELVKQINGLPGVKHAELKTKEQGLKEMKGQWGKDSDQFFQGLEGEGQNPLPDVIKIQPQDPKSLNNINDEVQKLVGKGIDSVDKGGDVTDRLLNFSSLFRTIVLIFGLGLAVLAAFLISNTIKLTIFARKQEIEIQRLVGASNWFIRWPFFIEGAFIGVVGAIFPTILVLLLYQGALSSVDVGGQYSILKLLPMLTIAMYVGSSLLILGVMIGIWGSIISVRRFLKI